MMEEKKFLTPQQVADRYGVVTVRTLANWRSIGQGPNYIKIGGRVMYSVECVAEWEKTRKRKINE